MTSFNGALFIPVCPAKMCVHNKWIEMNRLCNCRLEYRDNEASSDEEIVSPVVGLQRDDLDDMKSVKSMYMIVIIYKLMCLCDIVYFVY